MTKPFRLAQLSDLHFAEVEFNIKQFFSKRWIGNFNYLLRRKKDFNYNQLEHLPSLLKEQKVDLVLLSGDLTCTASEAEFRKAQVFVQKLKDEGLDVVVIPGNHDNYTKEAYQKKLFYDFFPSSYEMDWDLKKHHVALKPLKGNWWLLLLDTTLATPLLCCHGRFSEEAEKHVKEVLSSLPSDANIVLANHFPIDCKKSKPALQRRSALFSLFKDHPKVRIYLHGHNHNHTLLDLRKERLPIAVDAGSVSHEKEGSWTLMQCEEKGCSFESFRWNRQNKTWMSSQPLTSFHW